MPAIASITTPTETVWGAAPEDWAHFDVVLGLTEELLPVVSNPKATISPGSKMKDLGKTPSRYNASRNVVGIPEWTQLHANGKDMKAWSIEPDYGVCVQTRMVRALDVDVTDPVTARAIGEFIAARVSALPRRQRSNSSKFLLAFTLPGDIPKRKMVVQGGVIEFLATGQQFVAVGTHPSGVRYEWENGLPDEFPVLTVVDFEALWTALETRFATQPAGTPTPSAAGDDPLMQEFPLGLTPAGIEAALRHLDPDAGYDEWLKIGMALHFETSGEGFELWNDWSARGSKYPGADALQGHWQSFGRNKGRQVTARTLIQMANAHGASINVAAPVSVSQIPVGHDIAFVDFASLAHREPPPRRWIVDEWLPRGAVTALFGRGGHGKSLLAQQLAIAVANGTEWLGLQAECGPVIGLFCEDDSDELLRRGSALFAASVLDAASGGVNLHLDARAGKFNTLVSYDNRRLPVGTGLMMQLREQCQKIQPVLVILDNIAQLFAGQENVRNEVTTFCNELTGVAREFDCAVLLLGHLPKTEGGEYSGSTAWDAAVRARLLLERLPDGTSVLKKLKANYSALDEIPLEYQQGVFQQLANGHQISDAALEPARRAIKTAIETLTKQQRSASHTSTARNFLVKIMKEENLFNGITPELARLALSKMLTDGEIEPNATMPWKTSTRHAVKSLRVVSE